MALILHIDTATETASASISKDGKMLHSRKNEVQKDHATFLHPAIAELFNVLTLKPADLDAVAVSAGPGSYTGLRVGFAAAKGLAYSLNIPFISISTLLLMSKAVAQENPGNENAVYCPMIDARRMEVFTALYDNDMQELKHAHSLILSENSFQHLQESKKIFFFGSGAEKWKSLCNIEQASFPAIPDLLPSFAKLSSAYFSEKKFTELSLSAPLYGKEFYSN